MDPATHGDRPDGDAAHARHEDPATRVVPVIEEELHLGTVSERTGTVRIRKRSSESAPLAPVGGYREIVETERVAVGKAVERAEAPWHDGEELVIPVYAEQWVRQLVLVEELRVRRRRVPTETSTDFVVRREELIIERLDPDSGEWIPAA